MHDPRVRGAQGDSCHTGPFYGPAFAVSASARWLLTERGSGPAGTRLKKNQSSVLGNINIRNFGYESFQASTAHEGVCLRFFSKKKTENYRGLALLALPPYLTCGILDLFKITRAWHL